MSDRSCLASCPGCFARTSTARDSGGRSLRESQSSPSSELRSDPDSAIAPAGRRRTLRQSLFLALFRCLLASLRGLRFSLIRARCLPSAGSCARMGEWLRADCFRRKIVVCDWRMRAPRALFGARYRGRNWEGGGREEERAESPQLSSLPDLSRCLDSTFRPAFEPGPAEEAHEPRQRRR